MCHSGMTKNLSIGLTITFMATVGVGVRYCAVPCQGEILGHRWLCWFVALTHPEARD